MTAYLLTATGTIISVVIGILAAGLVVFTLIYSYIRKKQGKSGCDCGCDCCSCREDCHPSEKNRNDSTKTDHP